MSKIDRNGPTDPRPLTPFSLLIKLSRELMTIFLEGVPRLADSRPFIKSSATRFLIDDAKTTSARTNLIKRRADMPRKLDHLIGLRDEMKTLRARHAKRGLAKKARKLLELLSAHSHTPVARLWRHLGKTSPSVQNAIRTEPEAANLVNGKEVRIGRSTVWLAEPSEAGFSLLGKEPPDCQVRPDQEER